MPYGRGREALLKASPLRKENTNHCVTFKLTTYLALLAFSMAGQVMWSRVRALTAQPPYMALMPQSRPRMRKYFIKAIFLRQATHEQRVMHIFSTCSGWRSAPVFYTFYLSLLIRQIRVYFLQIHYHKWSSEQKCFQSWNLCIRHMNQTPVLQSLKIYPIFSHAFDRSCCIIETKYKSLHAISTVYTDKRDHNDITYIPVENNSSNQPQSKLMLSIVYPSARVHKVFVCVCGCVLVWVCVCVGVCVFVQWQ